MKQVFISYNSNDSDKAEEILKRLEEAEISCWIAPRDIPLGGDYAVEIPGAIKNCSYFVILLSNAAQNSKYVMMELGQAIKQDKRIIPILLEHIVPNEKTDFFLSEKQNVDAAKDFHLAVNEVVRRIKGGERATQSMPHVPTRTMSIRNTSGRCPYCKCTSVKRSRSSLEMYLHPEEGIEKDQKMTVWLMKSEIIIQTIVPFLFIIPVFVGVVGFASFLTLFVKNNAIHEIVAAVVSLLFMAAAFLCIYAYVEIRDEFFELRKTISVSKLRYWKLKCLGCEKKFGILLPKDDALKDWFPDLLDENEIQPTSENNQIERKQKL